VGAEGLPSEEWRRKCYEDPLGGTDKPMYYRCKECVLKFGCTRWQFNDSTEPALTVVVLSAGTRLYAGRRLLLSRRVKSEKSRTTSKQLCSQKVIVRGKIIQFGSSACFLGVSVNWSWNFPEASLLKVRADPERSARLAAESSAVLSTVVLTW